MTPLAFSGTLRPPCLGLAPGHGAAATRHRRRATTAAQHERGNTSSCCARGREGAWEGGSVIRIPNNTERNKGGREEGEWGNDCNKKPEKHRERRIQVSEATKDTNRAAKPPTAPEAEPERWQASSAGPLRAASQ